MTDDLSTMTARILPEELEENIFAKSLTDDGIQREQIAHTPPPSPELAQKKDAQLRSVEKNYQFMSDPPKRFSVFSVANVSVKVRSRLDDINDVVSYHKFKNITFYVDYSLMSFGHMLASEFSANSIGSQRTIWK